jgi:hypothetical protein
MTPVIDGSEKYAPVQAAGALGAMVTSRMRTTETVPRAGTISGVSSGCGLPVVPVAKLHVTPLGVLAEQ